MLCNQPTTHGTLCAIETTEESPRCKYHQPREAYTTTDRAEVWQIALAYNTRQRNREGR